jgi:ribosomal protein S1
MSETQSGPDNADAGQSAQDVPEPGVVGAEVDAPAPESGSVTGVAVPAPAPQEIRPVTAKVPPPAPLIMQVLGGIVTAVSDREVELTLDDGRPAVIHRENFDLAQSDPTTVLQVGDGAQGAVLSREDPKDRVVLSRKWLLRDRAWKRATSALADHSPLHCRVTSVSRKGAVVDVMGLRGFVPLTHLQLTDDPPSSELVGELVDLQVIAADRQKDRLLLSRRSALLKEQRRSELEAFHSLEVGGTYTGVVEELAGFGAFVNVNGVRGLLHNSEMSWDRVGSPKGVVAVGDTFPVKVIDLKPKKRRLGLSRRALMEDPLASVEVGSVHAGTVTRLVDYGVFVDIGPAEGMVHLSELAEYRPAHPSEIVLKGDQVQVKVLAVNRAKRRIELSIRQALYSP